MLARSSQSLRVGTAASQVATTWTTQAWPAYVAFIWSNGASSTEWGREAQLD
jgi:hypothetical protein